MAYGQLGSILMSAQGSLGNAITTSNRTIAIVKENIEYTIAQIKEMTMYGRFGESPRHQGVREVKGSFDFEPQPTALGALLYAVCGQDTVSFVASVATHKFRPRDTADFDPGPNGAPLTPYTFLLDRNSNTSSIMSVYDMIATDFTLSAKNGELLKGSIGWVGGAYQEVARVAPTFPPEKPWSWNQFSGTYAGQNIINFRDFSISIKNNIEGIFVLGNSYNPAQYRRKSQVEVSGKATLLFQSNSLMLNFTNAPAVQSQMIFQFVSNVASPALLKIDMPQFRINKWAPVMAGPGIIEVPFDFTCQYDTTSSYQIEFSLTNTVAVYP
jgi:hypothetical protein